MSNKWQDHVTTVAIEAEKQFLGFRLPDVNMRLFAASEGYRRVVRAACNHLRWLCLANLEGYKKPHGISGANAGIPWNIIGIVGNRGKASEHCVIMINPLISEASTNLVSSETSCGSVPGERCTVMRHEWVRVHWFDEHGIPCMNRIHREDGAFTVQHEIDHNRGILITDRKI